MHTEETSNEPEPSVTFLFQPMKRGCYWIRPQNFSLYTPGQNMNGRQDSQDALNANGRIQAEMTK